MSVNSKPQQMGKCLRPVVLNYLIGSGGSTVLWFCGSIRYADVMARRNHRPISLEPVLT